MSKPAAGATLDPGNALNTNVGVDFLFNEGSGAPKELVSGATITVSGTLTWGTDATYGAYLQGDGSTGYAQANYSAINGATSLSLSVLFQCASATTGARIFQKGWPTEYGLILNEYDSSGNCTAYVDSAEAYTSTSVVDGTWHWVHVTVGGGTITPYLDGVAKTTASVTFSGGSGDLFLWCAGNIGAFSAAKLSNLTIWQNRVLTPSDISTHIANPWARYATTGGSGTGARRLRMDGGIRDLTGF